MHCSQLFVEYFFFHPHDSLNVEKYTRFYYYEYKVDDSCRGSVIFINITQISLNLMDTIQKRH